ncbi:unnamed protein product [Colias eurytheme]|nr:unnamed protein product [Colias eurytheme]
MKQMISDRLKPHLESSIKDSKYKTQFKNMFRRRMTKNRDMTKKNKVELFLSGDENSSFTAGKKEFVKKNGVKHQKRYLNDSLANLHKKFISSCSFPLSFATFCRFRPFWILPASKRPRETCLCVIHENFKLLVSALHKYKVIEPKDPTNLIKTICCSEYNPKCLFRDCAECKLRDIEYLAIDNNIDFLYWTWSSKTEKLLKNGSEKVIRLVKKEKVITKPNEAIKHLKETLNKYMRHCGRMVNQQKAIKKIKEQLKFDEAVIHIDYSENYKCAYSKEIQSAHFGASKPQITIHTSVLYFYDVNGQKKSQCFATLSSSLRHDTAAVWAHMEPLLDFLKIHCPQANTFHVISDSASSQYRNYKIYFVITALSWNYPELKCVTWNYSESGHGKGAPDGVGAVLKRTADACVSYGTDVPDFESFTLLLKQNLKNIMIETISEYKILEKDMLLPKTLLPFKGTQKVHQIVWCNSNPRSVTLRQLSCTKETCLTKAEYCKHGKHLGFHVVIRDQIATPAPEKPRYLRKRLSAVAVARILDFDSDSDSFTAPSTSIADDLNPNESVTLLHRSRPFSALSEMELPPELRRSTLDKILDEGSTNVTVSPLNSFKHIIDNDSDSDYSIF